MRILLVLLLVSVALSAQVDAWREDLSRLVSELPKRHKDAFTLIDESRWLAEARKLDARLEELPDAGVFEFELMKLIALIGDSHTRLVTRNVFTRKNAIPIGVIWFEDGPRVIQLPRAHKGFIGWKLVGIGGVSLDEAVKRMGTVQVLDNEARTRQAVARLVRSGTVLHLLGLSESAESATFQLSRGAQVKTLEIKAGGFGALPARRAPRATMVTAKQGQKYFWTRFFEDEGLLYVQYNRCASNASWDVSDLTRRLVERLDSGAVKTFVFDVRYNPGGNSMIADMMFARLARHEPLKSRRNVFCIVGRATFSSAILNAMTLKRSYGAQLVGESTGGSPNHFGEVKTFELPNSKLTVGYSTKFFRRGDPGATTINPDHPAAMTYADFVAGRDPALDRIRKLVR